jgi:hypothetical protein
MISHNFFQNAAALRIRVHYRGVRIPRFLKVQTRMWILLFRMLNFEEKKREIIRILYNFNNFKLLEEANVFSYEKKSKNVKKSILYDTFY